MRTGRPVAKIELPAEVAGILEGYTQRRKTAQALALRARIVLGCAGGLSNTVVAARERVTPQTVGKWPRRFVERGLDGLLDEPRPGVPRKIDDANVKSVIVQTLEACRQAARIGARAAWPGSAASRPRTLPRGDRAGRREA
jgi:hypothetical protein